MFNAEDIIELEKKWFQYRTKKNIKFYGLMLICLTTFSIALYQIVLHDISNSTPKAAETNSAKAINIPIAEANKTAVIKKILATKEKNTTTKTSQIKDLNISKIKLIEVNQTATKSNTSNPKHFRLEPTIQGSGLFSSDGFLTLHTKHSKMTEESIVNKQSETVQPIRKITIKKKPKISIDMQEVDTIKYLKDRYYSTSSIVFALMLSEEYYFDKKYKSSLKWALIANDIDAQNTKSWYWFAKSKVKLNKKEDAIKALKAYLSNNSSKKLSTLLEKIETGDIDD